MNNYAIILAGGVGSRFWPLSRELEPKQFLDVCLGRPMIEETLRRIAKLIKKRNIYVATNRLHMRRVSKLTKRLGIPLKNLFFEPAGKNTFAPIGLLSKKINSFDPEAIIVVLPCDHFIKEYGVFLKLLRQAIAIAKKGYIVSVGIAPERPETGYGYIKISSQFIVHGSKAYRVEKFIEKPDLKKAREFLKSKKYYWNAGIFIFKASVILDEAKRFAPATYSILRQIKNNQDLNRLWHRLPAISVDYAIMEKTRKLALLPGNFGWSDLGSWQAVQDIAKKDKHGNIFRGNCIDLGSRNSLIWSGERLVATLGLDNVFIVDTKDALLVCSKDKSQDVKKIVQILKRKNFKKQI